MPDETLSVNWSAQSLANLEEGSPNPATLNPAAMNGYIAQTIIPEDAINSVSHSAAGFATRIYVPEPGTCTHVDFVTASGTLNVTIGLFPATALGAAVAPLVWTAATAEAVGVNSFTWNGASSPTSVQLAGNTFYYIYSYHASGTTTVACCTAGTAAALNPNLTATTANTASYSSPQTTVTASTNINGGTPAIAATKIWYGLR